LSAPVDPAYVAGVALEGGLMLGGLGLLWSQIASPAARARRRPDALTPWPGPASDLLLLLLLAFCGGLLLPLGLNTVLARFPVGAEARLLLTAAAFQGGLLLGVLVYYLAYNRRGESASALITGADLRRGAATMLIALPLVYGAAAVWQGLLTWAGVPLDQENSIEDFQHLHTPLLRLAFILIATIAAPVTEELIFRAGLFRFLRGRLPLWLAVLLSSLLFAAIHQSLASLAGLTMLAAVCALAYQRTGRLGTAIVAHALFNLTTVVVILLGVNA
jgi:membrane protease YdiL (CAAX protease family)